MPLDDPELFALISAFANLIKVIHKMECCNGRTEMRARIHSALFGDRLQSLSGHPKRSRTIHYERSINSLPFIECLFEVYSNASIRVARARSHLKLIAPNY